MSNIKNKTINVAILQLKAWPFSKHEENKEHIFQFIEKASTLKPDLIVLPECVYPCYFLSPRIIPDYKALGILCDNFLTEIKNYAKKYGTFLALCLPEYIPDKNLLYNSAVLIDDKGEEIGRTRKSFLWHFDSKWFKPDSYYPVFDTRIGKIGMFICADGRQPEIARSLSLQGAEVLLDFTNLVTTGLEKRNWTNPQVDYIIPTRALENRIWIVLANKVGFEENSIQCCGKSAFFPPDGEAVKMASSDHEEILFKEIDLSLSNQKNINNAIDVFKDRRPELYDYITLPTNNLPEKDIFLKPSDAKIKNPFAAVIQIKGQSSSLEKDDDFSTILSRIEYYFHTLAEQDVDILSFSQINNLSIQNNTIILDLLKELTKNTSRLCSFVLKENEGSANYKTIYLVQSGKVIGRYSKTHIKFPERDNITPGKDGFPVYKTQFGNIGLLLDYEGFFPEIARILTLKGADIIIWAGQFGLDEHIKICQTRSAENKIFTICLNSIEQNGNGHSVIVSPSGQIIAGCLENQEIASATSISICMSRDKVIVPNTNAILNRLPESYYRLTSL